MCTLALSSKSCKGAERRILGTTEKCTRKSWIKISTKITYGLFNFVSKIYEFIWHTWVNTGVAEDHERHGTRTRGLGQFVAASEAICIVKQANITTTI